MTTKVFSAIIAILLTVCFTQVTIVALNNDGYGESPYNDGIKEGRSRWVNDIDGPLSTCAITNAYRVLATDDQPDETYVWYAYGRAMYGGGNTQYQSNYDCKADAKGFVQTVSGPLVRKLLESCSHESHYNTSTRWRKCKHK